MDHALLDLRDTMRSLWRDPVHAAAVIATLALTLGASTAVFSILNGAPCRSAGVSRGAAPRVASRGPGVGHSSILLGAGQRPAFRGMAPPVDDVGGDRRDGLADNEPDGNGRTRAADNRARIGHHLRRARHAGGTRAAADARGRQPTAHRSPRSASVSGPTVSAGVPTSSAARSSSAAPIHHRRCPAARSGVADVRRARNRPRCPPRFRRSCRSA